MDDQLSYDDFKDDERLLIGNLLADEDNYTPDVPRRSNNNLEPIYPPTTGAPWPENYSSPVLDRRNWNLISPESNHSQWTVKPPPLQQQPFNFNNFTESSETTRFAPLSLSFNPPVAQERATIIPLKPTATVFPFQSNYETSKSDETLSPVSDERTSDSGTISPDSRSKRTKWKNFDLTSLETTKSKSEVYSRQNSENLPQNGKSYSSVAQVHGQHLHKRLGATSSVPLAKPNSKQVPKKNINNRTTRAATQPATPEDSLPPKPSKIVGLNPITTTPVASEPPKVSAPPSAPVVVATAAVVNPDFQKIKRKKKGKGNSKKIGIKQADEQKPSSRYQALVQTDLIKCEEFLLQNGGSDDEDEEFDETKEEAKKEQIRQQARRQFADDQLPEAEAVQKMEKLENEIRAIFEKRKTAKQQRSLRHRRRKGGYQLMIPSVIGVITSMIVAAIYHSFTFFINLVANVLVLSCHAINDSSKALIYHIYQAFSSFVGISVDVIYKATCDLVEHFKLIGGVEVHIGLPANAPLPQYTEDVLERLYACPNPDAYSVLGLPVTTTADEIELYFKVNTTLINPDRNFNVGCEAAYNLLHYAHDLVSSQELRNDYLWQLEQVPQTYELMCLLDELRNSMDNKGALLHCDCNENHALIRISSLSTYEGRYCGKCNQNHPVRNGDLWVDRQYFGWVLTYYAVINNVVYDVTDWINCGANIQKRPKPNSHMITSRLFNASTNASVTNVTERHRCFCRPEQNHSRNGGPPKESQWKYACCCSLVACPPTDSYPANEIPCCFGGIFVAINTTAAPLTAAEKLTDNDRALKKAGRRRAGRR